MPFVPAAMNFGLFPIPVPSIMYREPAEGRQSITFDVDWSRPIAKSLDTVEFNLQNNAPQNFRQICGLIVDNSNCGSDLDFIFPDTGVTISIPAYAPYTVLQVNTQQVQFYLRGLGVINGDATQFSVLNFAPAPVAVPITVMQQVASVASITMDGVSSTSLINANVNGTVQGLNVTVACPKPSASFNNVIRIADGAGTNIWQGNMALQDTSDGQTVCLVNLNINKRFVDGLRLFQAGGVTPGATIDVNIYYRIP